MKSKSFVLIVSILAGAQNLQAKIEPNNKHDISSEIGESIDEETKKLLIEALKINENLHAAFFDYQANAVENFAKELKTVLQKIKNPNISKKLSYSLSKLALISQEADRSLNDENYHIISMTLIHLLKQYNISSDYDSFTCPMVKKKWIQNTRMTPNVENPYAPEMKSCGSKES